MNDIDVPRIKICGVTSLEDAGVVVDAGADALGLIYAASVRQVVAEVAFDIIQRHREDLWCVGVFRHQEEHEIVRIVDRDSLGVVQLHDPASASLLDALAARGVNVVRALSADAPELNDRERHDVVAVVIDGAQPGSGVANDWTRVYSLHFDVPVLIAGGLTADTVAHAIAATSPWGVDVATGVESFHGVKDPVHVSRFVSRARAALSQKGAP